MLHGHHHPNRLCGIGFMRVLRLPLLLSVAASVSCSSGRPSESSAVCGITLLASANMVIRQASNAYRILSEPPAGLEGRVPARVVGYGTATARVQESGTGLILAYEGDGFPAIPGFGVALVDDSSEVFRGILIFDLDIPAGYPQLGAITHQDLVMPLLGLRVTWSSVSNDDCPLFAAIDTVTVAE